MLQIIILGTAKMAVYVLQMVMAQSAATVGAVTTLHAFQTSFVDYVWWPHTVHISQNVVWAHT